MARIIDSENTKRRMIRLSSTDVISVVREYQSCIKVRSSYEDTKDALENIVIYIPEEV